MTTKEQQQLNKIIDEIIATSMEQIQFLIKNHELISSMSNGGIRTDKVDNFRSAIGLVYMAGLNKGILANRDCKVVISLLDAQVVNETLLDFQIALYREKIGLK